MVKAKKNCLYFKNKKEKNSDQLEYIFNDGSGFIFHGKRIRLSRQEIYLCKCMNGKNTIEDLKRKFYKKFGLRLSNSVLYRFVHNLKKDNLLGTKVKGRLISKLSSIFIKEQLRRFEKSRIRKPTFAGLCYKSNPKDLYRDLTKCFATVDSRKLATLGKRKDMVKGIIVPHSNIELSGPCAAWAYQALTRWPMPELFIIVAPDHSLSLKYSHSVMVKDFCTPLGLVRTDRDFIRTLAKKCCFNIFNSSDAHIRDYSVEVQLPFLQYIFHNRQKRKKIRIVPILCRREPHSKVLIKRYRFDRYCFIKALHETIIETKKNVVFITTIDLLHTNKWGETPNFHKKNEKIINFLKHMGRTSDNLKLRLGPGEQPPCGMEAFFLLTQMISHVKTKVLNYSCTSNSDFIKNCKANTQFVQLIDIGYVSIIFY